MSGYVCSNCRSSMRRVIRPVRSLAVGSVRPKSTSTAQDHQPGNNADTPENGESNNSRPKVQSKRKIVDVGELLATPTWSVRTLLPDPKATSTENTVTFEQVRHLLRLSALPEPQGLTKQAEVTKVLNSQLHFVQDIQKVDTEGVEPLRSIRDETGEGLAEITIGLDALKDALAKEDIKGRNRRPRRRRGEAVDTFGAEDWDVLGSASEAVEMNGAKYFVVKGGSESDHKAADENKHEGSEPLVPYQPLDTFGEKEQDRIKIS